MPKLSLTQESTADASTHELALLYQDQAKAAMGDIDKGYLDLAEALFEIKHKELYRSLGIPTFQDYCKDALDLEYGKAHALTRIWDSIKSLGLPRHKLEEIGWTKARLLCQHLTDENSEELLDNAATMTRSQLQDFIAIKTKGEGYSRTDSLILKFPADSPNTKIILEAIEIGKRNFETEDLHVALAAILTDWMSTNGMSPEKVPVETFLRLCSRVYGGKFTHIPENVDDDGYEEYNDDIEEFVKDEITVDEEL